MNMSKIFASFGFGLTLGLFAVSPAIAHSTHRDMSMTGMMGGDCPMMGMMDGREMGSGRMRGRSGMGAMAAGRLAYLKSELQISDAQVAVWQGYVDAVNARVATMQGMHETMVETMQSGNAMQRMDVRISGMEAMLGAMKAIKPATETLYAALSAEQKTAADQLIGADCGAM